MVKLSIIIVNYNVVHFLEQCLRSVEIAINKSIVDVWVVDNNSVDGSCNMVKEKFPWVKLIENKKNTGFSVANNQAIKESDGEYVLLLNPDTVIEEDTITKIIDFMDSTPDAGGLGVKMIDGKGNFLPESKRGLPTPKVAFYKIFGLSSLFPNSKKFNVYHLGHLDKNETNEVDILSGAFMMMRREALDKVGLLDETFFMYGEDIDLSYRIVKGGYKNYYFADTTIIHYKGESTKKGSLNYVKVFYNAMIIFAEKHFSSKNASMYSFFINIAIYLRATISIISQAIKKAFLPAADAMLLFLSFWFIAPLWENIKYKGGGNFPAEYFLYAVPSYILIWITSIWISGGYEKPFRVIKQLKGFLWGTAALLIFYSLLPETMRYSRAMLLFGTISGIIGLNLIRTILHLLNVSDNKYYLGKRTKVAIVGKLSEAKRITDIIKSSVTNIDITGVISPNEVHETKGYIGSITQIDEIIRVNKIQEIIFCSEDIQSQTIIQLMLKYGGQNINYKIATPESLAIIGSNSIDTAGDLYTVDLNNISKPENKRIKRLLDVFLSTTFLALLPVTIWIPKRKSLFIKNIFSVLIGLKSWVGYYCTNTSVHNLPKIRKGVLNMAIIKKADTDNTELMSKINLFYAQNYKLSTDIDLIIKGFKHLGN